MVKLNSDRFCNYLLAIFLIIIGGVYYYLSKNILPLSNIFLLSSPIDKFYNLINPAAVDWHHYIHFKNIVYTFILYFSGNVYISYLFTSFVLYVISCVLVYMISNLHKPNRYYGLLAVLMFSVLSDMLLHVLALNIHVSETMYVLLILYFWEKSDYFTNKQYFLLYVIFSIISCFGRFSIVGYLGSFCVFTTYFSIKKSRYFVVVFNACLLVFLLTYGFKADDLISLGTKIYNIKIFMNLSFSDKFVFFYNQFMLFGSKMYNSVARIYFYPCIAFCILRIFYPYKIKHDIVKFINYFIFVIFLLYFLVLVPNGYDIPQDIQYNIYIYDALPLWALLSIAVVNFIYIYQNVFSRIRLFVFKVFIILICYLSISVLPFFNIYNFLHMRGGSYILQDCQNYFRYKDLIDYLSSNINRVNAKQYLFSVEVADKEVACKDESSCTFYEALLNIANLTGFELHKISTEENKLLRSKVKEGIDITENSFVLFNTPNYNLSSVANYQKKNIFEVNIAENSFEISVYSIS